ncbi:hypothetical protein FS749_005404 [Ceratobasidium sp. UAMH 11750]|nr:hypothetical protein FS749_005404 [Ceratobasidium sp. UAMH 11750]
MALPAWNGYASSSTTYTSRVGTDLHLIDESKPSNWNILCEWQLAKEDPHDGGNPSGPAAVGSVVLAFGELKFMPGDSEGEVDASSF